MYKMHLLHHRRAELLTAMLTLLVCGNQLVHALESAASVGPQQRSLLRGPQGIVVPKRSALIMGLNNQFKLRNSATAGQAPASGATDAPAAMSPPAGLAQQQQQLQLQALAANIGDASGNLLAGGDIAPLIEPSPPANTNTNTNSIGKSKLLAPINWLASRSQQRRQQQQQQQLQLQVTSPQPPSPPMPSVQPQQHQQLQSLYLDRYQQQLLAANPALLNPESETNLTNLALLTRSDAALLSGGNLNALDGPHLAALAHLNMTHASHRGSISSSSSSSLSQMHLQQQQQQLTNGAGADASANRQLYRGFSLIELEVKSDSDRRYVQDLYGNLSAALNEQAANPNSPTVSPYADVDFWSLKYGLNDRIDIMVSPKSRAFILSQLLRSRIRHRIKIDDIQARLDQQQQQQQPSAALNNLNGGQLAQSSSAQHLAASSRSSGSAGDTPLSARQSDQQRIVIARQAPSGGGGGETLVGPGTGTGAAASSSNAAGKLNETNFFDDYQRVADINQWLESLVERNREIARVKVIGRSSQGRYLRVLKLGYEQEPSSGWTPPPPPVDLGDAGRQPSVLDNASYILDSFMRRQAEVSGSSGGPLGSIWLDGGTHAREWISPATVLYIAHRLADNHYKCQRFFDSLAQLVAVGKQSASLVELELQSATGDNHNKDLSDGANEIAAARSAKSMRYSNYSGNSQPLDVEFAAVSHLAPHATSINLQPLLRPPPLAANLDPSLLPSINEINTSLLGKPVAQVRQRTELERTMEQLAKSPRELALASHRCDLELDQLLRKYTFYLMPVLNPDGYEYSHTHNRLWRKTRSTSNHPIYRHFCLGADPNRNYDARHGQTGSSTHPCSQTYAGTVPFTEPETRHQSNFVYANRLNMKMFISFHSYSQMILLPFSHSKQLAPDHKDLESVGQAAVKAIERTHGTVYRVGPSASILYTASGTASDWAYEKAGIKYSYTIELRDTGNFGFLLPRTQIVPTGEETFNGLLAMIEQMEKNDNLLTSKAHPSSTMSGSNNNNSNNNKPASAFPEVVATLSPAVSPPSALQMQDTSAPAPAPVLVPGAAQADTNHVPDTEHLKPLSSQAVRPPLENILDSGASWASAEHPLSGVRDRRPPQKHSAGGAAAASLESAIGSRRHFDMIADDRQTTGEAQHAPRDEETTGDDVEPDAGYAFEGEGELMEPTELRDNILREAAAMRISGRREHSRRIVHAAGLTSTGRSFINSPLMQGGGAREQLSAPRRESSERLLANPNN